MATDTDKRQKENGLKDYGIIYISAPIRSGNLFIDSNGDVTRLIDSGYDKVTIVLFGRNT